jgi:hypothetical protein
MFDSIWPNHDILRFFPFSVIENYQYRDEAAKGKFSSPDIKDFKRLNKAVLREKATNAAVSTK